MHLLTLSNLFYGYLMATFISVSIYLIADFLADLELGKISSFATFIRDRW